jgi:uncharacterized protein YjiS (DUF1127 family)
MESLFGRGSASRSSFSSSVGGTIRRISRTGLIICDTLFVWLERVRQRRQLLSLSDQMLSDIGVSRADVFKECEKPFWRE